MAACRPGDAVSATPDVNASAVPAAPRPRSGFWAAAFAFLIVMAVATLPSPLYGLYRTRDHLSALTITVVFAIFAGSTIAILQRDSSIAARIGRRGTMLGAVATMMVAVGVLAAWKDLPGLLIGRLVTGVSVGLAAGTAITYLIELRLRADPKASPVRARTTGDGRRPRRRDQRVRDARSGFRSQRQPDPCGLFGEWPVRRAVRTLPRHYAAPSLARPVRCRALPSFCLRRGSPAGHAAGIARARSGSTATSRG
jgi:Sugar (and other) transporter